MGQFGLSAWPRSCACCLQPLLARSPATLEEATMVRVWISPFTAALSARDQGQGSQ